MIDIAKLFISLNVKNMLFAFPHGQGNAWEYFDEVVPKYTEIKNYLHNLVDYNKKYNKEN